MSHFLTEADETIRRFELAERQSRHRHHRVTPSLPTPRRRTRIAAGLRRVADRLDG